MQTLTTIGTVTTATIGADHVFTSIGEATSFALTSSLFGIAIVFGVLALLWGVLELFRIVFYKDPAQDKNNEKARKAAQKVAEKAAPVKEAAPVATPVAATPAATSDDELVAAITAAIEAYRSANGVTGGFRVVSFKRR